MFAFSLSRQALACSWFLPFWSKSTPAVRFCSPGRTICPFFFAFNKQKGDGERKQTNKEKPNPKTVRNWHLHQTHRHDSTTKKPKPTRRLLDVQTCISWNLQQLPRCGIQDKPWELLAAPPSPAPRLLPNPHCRHCRAPVGNSESAEIWFSSTLLNFC